LVLVTALFGGKKVKFPFPRYNQEMVTELKEMLKSGAFKPVIDRVYPLHQIVEAYRYAETGQKIGNIVISVNSSQFESHARTGGFAASPERSPESPAVRDTVAIHRMLGGAARRLARGILLHMRCTRSRTPGDTTPQTRSCPVGLGVGPSGRYSNLAGEARDLL
jgi:hypothetical protein